MQFQLVNTPYGTLEVSPWASNGNPDAYPVGTVRVRTPEKQADTGNASDPQDSAEVREVQMLTIGDMVDLRIDLVVLPDGTPKSYGSCFDISCLESAEKPRRIRYPEGDDLARVLAVAVEAANQVRTPEFLTAAMRATMMSSHLSASKTLYRAQQEVVRAQRALAEILEEGKRLGLEEYMSAQERELERFRIR